MPDTAAGETVDDSDTEVLGSLGGPHHFFLGPFPHAIGLAVAPDMWRQDRFVPGIDVVADRLAGQVIADCPAFQAVSGEDLVSPVAVGLVLGALDDVKMIAPTGEFQAVVTELLGLCTHGFKIQIGPLAGKQGNGSCHDQVLLGGIVRFVPNKRFDIDQRARIQVLCWSILMFISVSRILPRTWRP